MKMVGLTKARRVAVRKKKALLKFWSQPSKPERPVVGSFDRLKRSKKLNPNQTPKQRRDCLSSVSRPDGSNTLLTQALEQGAIEVSSRLFLRLSEHSQWQGESQLSSTGSPLTRASKRAKLEKKKFGSQYSKVREEKLRLWKNLACLGLDLYRRPLERREKIPSPTHPINISDGHIYGICRHKRE